MAYGLGYNPVRAAEVAGYVRSRGLLARVRDDVKKYPRAFSLAKWLLRGLDQGGAGTCWLHAPVAGAEILAGFKGLDRFPICRRLVGWAGKRLEGGGNPSNGGSGLDALLAMSNVEGKGFGVAHESLWPYSDSWWDLAEKPSAAVLADARHANLAGVVGTESDEDCFTMISTGHGISIGMPWSSYWDTAGATFFTKAGWFVGGHEVLKIGYVLPGVWDDFLWWQLLNSHGPIYAPLPAEHAAKVEGYYPAPAARVFDFWMRDDCLKSATRGSMYSESNTATDFEGLKRLCTMERVLADIFHQWEYAQ